jgi:hypothetical protein
LFSHDVNHPLNSSPLGREAGLPTNPRIARSRGDHFEVMSRARSTLKNPARTPGFDLQND